MIFSAAKPLYGEKKSIETNRDKPTCTEDHQYSEFTNNTLDLVVFLGQNNR